MPEIGEIQSRGNDIWLDEEKPKMILHSINLHYNLIGFIQIRVREFPAFENV